MTDKPKTTAQLLDADLSVLTVQEIERRKAIVDLQTSERNFDIAVAENQRHLDLKETSQRQMASRIADIQAQHDEEQRIQSICKHLTGGQDRGGFYNGDGEVYGSCTSLNQLPTGEVYGICFRCQKEWRHPKWQAILPNGSKVPGMRAVIEGKMTVAAYFEQERAYNAMLGLKRKTFEGQAGELPGGHMFSIPKLEAQQRKDREEFNAYLAQLPQSELLAAGVVRSVAV